MSSITQAQSLLDNLEGQLYSVNEQTQSINKQIQSLYEQTQSISKNLEQLDLASIKGQLDKEKKLLALIHYHPQRIILNVGGQRFETSLSVLKKCPGSLLESMFSGRHKLSPDPDGSYFIDRDPTHFRYLLNYLRDPESIYRLPKAMLPEIELEAEYYQLYSFNKRVEEMRLGGPGLTTKGTRLLSISNLDQYSPTVAALRSYGSESLFPEIAELKDRGNEIRDPLLFNAYDAVLVCCWNGLESEILGNNLHEYVSNFGGTVVVTCFSNSTNYTHPGGKFVAPVRIAADFNTNYSVGTINMPNHPILNGIDLRACITTPPDSRRSNMTYIEDPDNELIATFHDSKVLAASRACNGGMVVYLGFHCGTVGVGAAIPVVLNAARYKSAKYYNGVRDRLRNLQLVDDVIAIIIGYISNV